MEKAETVLQSQLPRQPKQDDLLKKPINVTITGSTGKIGYILTFMIGQGRMFGIQQPVNLTLLGVEQSQSQLEGLVMELEDSALPLIRSLKATTNLKEGFSGCELAILAGSRPREKNKPRSQFLIPNGKIFKEWGESLDEYAAENCKVLVVSNPVNSMTFVLQQNMKRIPAKNITALTRLDHNRALQQVSAKLKVPIEKIKNACVWANHSETQVADLTNALVFDYPEEGKVSKAKDVITDEQWIKEEYISNVQYRGYTIITKRLQSSAGSTASAICDHINDWLYGTPKDEFITMGIASDGSYGIPKGIVSSMPVICKDGDYEIVKGLKFDDDIKKRIEISVDELVEERDKLLEYFEQNEK